MTEAALARAAHWGGGLWISALDLARIGQLCLRSGQWGGRRLFSARWIEEMWRPCPVKPNYGLSWWLNDDRTVWPQAPSSGRCARENGGAHLQAALAGYTDLDWQQVPAVGLEWSC